MKTKIRIRAAVIIAAVFFLPLCSNAADENAARAPEDTPFTVIITGSRSYSDIDLMKKNIARISSVKKFSQTVASQKHIQFAGLFRGDSDQLVADIEGLAADRFDVQSKKDKLRGLVITLRKITEKSQ